VNVRRIDDARQLLASISDEGEREFLSYGLTCLNLIDGESADDLDAVAVLRLLRQMYSRRGLLEAVLRLDRRAYRWEIE